MQLRNELLLKLFFGNLVPIEVNIEHLEKYKKEFKNQFLYSELLNRNYPLLIP